MPRIEQMYAFVVSDSAPDDEGVIGMHTLTGWVPFVGADVSKVDELATIAQSIADTIGKEIRVLRFDGPPTIERTIVPQGPTGPPSV